MSQNIYLNTEKILVCLRDQYEVVRQLVDNIKYKQYTLFKVTLKVKVKYLSST